jgi:hypothetical protein
MQANGVTFTTTGRCNNSSGDGFAYDLGLADIAKRFAGSLESFAHQANHLRFEEHSRTRTGRHGHYLSHFAPPLCRRPCVRQGYVD